MKLSDFVGNINLAKKIGGSFALIIFFLLFGSAASWYSVHHLSEGSKNYLRYTENMMLANQLQQSLLQSRMRVIEYNLSGSPEALGTYRKQFEKFGNFLSRSHDAFTVGERPQLVNEIDDLAADYNKYFLQLVDYENQRQTVVNSLFELGPKLLKSLSKLANVYKTVGELETADQLETLEVLLMESRLKALKTIWKPSDANIEECRVSLKAFLTEINGVLDKFAGDKSRFASEIRDLESNVAAYQKNFEDMIFAVGQKQKCYTEHLVIVGPDLTTHVEQLTESISDDVEKLGKKLSESASSALNIIIIVSAVALGFAIIVSIVLTRTILKPITRVVEFSDILASGDLTATTGINQKDEVGKMAKSLENMANALREQFGEIRDGVHHLSSSSSELSAISSQLSSNAHDSDEVSQTVATLSEETSHNMASVAASVEQMSSNIRTVATAAEEMTSTINEISKNADKARSITTDAVQRMERTSDLMRQLERAASLIGNVTDTISGISKQTNLLALNATIEAASAGAAGKGFAVVANEIKELSRQTNEATVKISESIAGIQQSTKMSATEISGIFEIINEISSITTMIASAVEEQSASTMEIANNITQTSEGVMEITRNVDEVSKVSSETAKDVVKVSQASKEIAHASDHLNSSASEIAQFSERLNMIALKYKV